MVVGLLREKRLYKDFDQPDSFDRNLIVIGAGSAGLVASYIAAAVKARVTLIEKDKMGGDPFQKLEGLKIVCYDPSEEKGIKVFEKGEVKKTIAVVDARHCCNGDFKASLKAAEIKVDDVVLVLPATTSKPEFATNIESDRRILKSADELDAVRERPRSAVLSCLWWYILQRRFD